MKKKSIFLIILLLLSFSFCIQVEAKSVYTCKAIICSKLTKSECRKEENCRWSGAISNKCVARNKKPAVDSCTASVEKIEGNYCFRYDQVTCNNWTKVSETTVDNSYVSEYTNSDTYTFGGGDSCPLLGDPDKAGDFAYYLQISLNVMKYAGLVLVLYLTVHDIIKGLTEDNKDFSKTIVKTFIQRMIYAILLFFLPIIVNVILELLDLTGTCGIG